MTVNNTWATLLRYFEIMRKNKEIYAERKNFRVQKNKILYTGKNIKLAQMIIPKQFLEVSTGNK